MEKITTIGMTGISAAHGALSGARLRAGSAVSFVPEQRCWKQLPLVPRTVTPILTDNSTGVSVPGRRYRP
ncbi:hypothetical protein ACVGVM_23675 [Pseudonocardia bannensis]|uniref:Uncharacterized protein n=1 Tax=Pseudonocardia bannensis TaxID=630973 RepID=A0A848DPT9_9PSEU|nr:hypothetical protein [Pseudonocardia bannensis]NMH94847.1 hypothetical protein [Pseudonocardia bannensis]